MLKRSTLPLWTLLALAATPAGAETATETTPDTAAEMVSLESQLTDLQLPANVAPNAVSRERLYSVQTRYNPLAKRAALSIGTSRNFTGSRFLDMSQVNLDFRYNLSNRWSLVVGGSYGFNSFTADAKKLQAQDGIMPDAAIVKNRAHALVAYNLFYGKFRLSMDQVLYFDQYISVGPGMVVTQNGSSPSGVVDVGFIFWANRKWDVRIGLQNEFFNEKRMKSSGFERHGLGHIDIGYTFGGSESPSRMANATERL